MSKNPSPDAARELSGASRRKRPLPFALAAGVLLLLASVDALSQPTPPSAEPGGAAAGKDSRKKKLVGYFAEWSVYQRNYHVKDIPAAKLTHLNYAFAKISPAGECALVDAYAAIDKFYPGDSWDNGALRGNFRQLQLLKTKHPHLKTLISVGGWTLSGPFSDVAFTDAARVKFAKSCVHFMGKYGFDGVDIDWEYPVGGGLEVNKTRPADKQNCTLLLTALRRELDARGQADKKAYLLTIAAPAGPKIYAHLELNKVAPLIDWFNLMTYDFHGSWSPLTNFHAPLYASATDPTTDETVRKQCNVDAAVKGYRAAGVPADKLVVGVPFYGRGWGGVANVNRGLYQKHAAAPPPGTWEAGVFDSKDLAANYVGKYTRFWHEEAKVPWLFDAAKGTMISYDDPESLRLKAEYVNAQHLGGVMFWELSGDDAKASLLGALHAVLR
jgi:chitinase